MKTPLIVSKDDKPVEKRKVYQRLKLFEDQRGFSLSHPLIDNDTDSSKEKTGATKSKKKTGKTAFKTEAIAKTYIAACGLLAQNEMENVSSFAGSQSEVNAETQPMSPTPQPRWSPLGPSRIPDGQTYGAGRADVSGRVSCIAIDPTNADHILCGAAAGGVWETFNGGQNWSARTDHMPTLATGAIAFDPSAPNMVYVGTGEGNFYSAFGAGVLRSTDGGTRWSLLTATPFVGVGFFDIDVDANNGSVLLAGTTVGLYQSIDAGNTWKRKNTNRTWKISRAGGGNNEILAACADGVRLSINNGQNWSKVNLPGAPSSWRRLSVDHVDSDVRIAYAFGSGSDQTPFLYRRSADGTWLRISDLPPDLRTSQDWYDWFLASAPDRTDQVYLGAINVHRGTISGDTWSWINLSAKTSGDSIHPDQHAIKFDPNNPNIVYIGNDGGLYRSNNRGINWTSLNSNLAITEIEYIAQDNGSHHWLMAGTQDNGTNRYNGRSVWRHIADGDGGDCAVNSLTPNVVYHSYFGMGLHRSEDRGDTWGGFIENGRRREGYRALFYPPMESRENTICQAGESMFISRNSGVNWTEVNLPQQGIASSMYIPTADQIYIGTTTGEIYRTTWNGIRWSAPTTLTSPRNAYVSDLHVKNNRLWATYSTVGNGRVFRSDDGGSSWNDMTSGLPAIPMRAIQVQPNNPNRIWVAGDIGVYQSFDAGRSWKSFSLGLPNTLVGDLIYNPHTRILRVGTRNRGAWEIPVNGDLSKPRCGRQFIGSLGPNKTGRWFTFRWPATWHVIWTAVPTTVKTGSPQLDWNVQVERADAEYATYWITVKNLTDQDLSFEGRYCITNYY